MDAVLHHVVIVGGGFGGLWAARGLTDASVRITLIDRQNHHLFQPLLYQVATAGLSAPAIAAPLRHILRKQTNVTTLMAEVRAIDRGTNTITFADDSTLADTLTYDTLILAAGATHSYFGNDAWREAAPGLKTLDDALLIRQRVLTAFERAETCASPEERSQWLTFAVVGAGPTGVEMAGTLAEIARHTLKGEFRRADPSQARIVLLEGGPRVLGAFDATLSAKARSQLETLGVEVWSDTLVTHIDQQAVIYKRAGETQTLAARTTVWAAGVAASPLGRALGLEANWYDSAGRVKVNADLTVPGSANVYVIGDLAAVTSRGKPVPGVAAPAKQMGAHAARNIRRALSGKPLAAFVYRDYGNLATIGRNAAVVDLGWLKLTGRPAWLFWVFIHIFFLISFRARLMVMLDLAAAYLTFGRGARIVTGVSATRRSTITDP